jgi:hypothetical protein
MCCLLGVFLVLFVQVELLGLFALQLIGTGKVAAGTLLYAGKIPVAAFTFWLFRVSKEKLMTFGWFKRSYELIMLIIEKIKHSAIHQRIAARLKQVKAWLKIKLYRSRLYIGQFVEAIKNSITFEKIK